ncbi:MAG TPA: methionine adenosyltransferase [Patescibacteria group bacterium]|nr:methionine adenosyltransferase [Patescibacteria group bacterium]
MNSIFTSESVCAGHPDKVCDQISDAVVDAALAQDPKSRVAIETVAGFNHLFMLGEVTTSAKLDYEAIAREQIRRLGYTDPKLNFSDQSSIKTVIHTQSSEIAAGVDLEGAGDQGMMFGFACKETKDFMPLPIQLAQELAQAVDQARENKTIPYLRPDGKSQVTVEYSKGQPVGIQDVVLAVPHSEDVELTKVKNDLYNQVVIPILNKHGFSVDMKNLIVNGTGVWNYGGPAMDAGLTGRKIIVDTYGGYARVGGGAFSGKDPTKVDRSGAYAARYIAKNIVAHGLAEKAEVRLAYFIGAQKPLMQEVETFGTNKVSKKIINDFMFKLLDTSVKGIIETLNLRRPIYLKTAAYGHFGRNEFPWERTAEI